MKKNTLDLETLKNAVSEAAAIRMLLELCPAAGKGEKVFPPTYAGDKKKKGEKVFPPTYAGGKYAVEERVDSNGEVEKCVILDSVQSQANRLEELLQKAVDEKEINLPVMKVVFKGLTTKDGDGEITALTAPHRWADAYFIHSQDKADGEATKFQETEVGKSLVGAVPKRATALFQYCPTSLLFGVWDSHRKKRKEKDKDADGKNKPGFVAGAKFARCLVSEIVAYGIAEGKRYAGKGDPMISGGDVNFDGKNKPSESGVGQIAPVESHGGITAKQIRQVSLISLAGLRRLRFPLDGKSDDSVDTIARTVVAALGLFALVNQFDRGYSLRSQCDLCSSEEELTFEIIRNGKTRQDFTIDKKSAKSLLEEAVKEAETGGLPWEKNPQIFHPTEKMKDFLEKQKKKDQQGDDA